MWATRALLKMKKVDKKTKFYAVAVGKEGPKVYHTWEECSRNVVGFVGNRHKSFSTLEEAKAFIHQHTTTNPTTVPTVAAAVGPSPSIGVRKRARVEEEEEKKEEKHAFVASPSPSIDSHHHHRIQSVYVDGACSHNGKGAQARAGYGGYYGSDDDPRNFALPVPLDQPQTNNRGELMAVLHVLQQAFAEALDRCDGCVHLDHPYGLTRGYLPSLQDSTLHPLPQLHIYTDSRYVLDGLEKYSKKWLVNGFKLSTGGMVLNQDIWKPLLEYRNAYNHHYALQQNRARRNDTTATTTTATREEGGKDLRIGVQLHHVKGHSNIHGNEKADKLAVMGSQRHL